VLRSVIAMVDAAPMTEPVRWGILGTAGIAASAFLPALAETGSGEAVAVASRDLAKAEHWAAANDVAEGLEGYAQVLEDPRIEAVYIPLPNGLHAEWAIAALQAGKTVFCEKPLCGTVQETAAVLDAAAVAEGPLWEAFVFPFHEQIELARSLIADGAIGDLREIRSSFHFSLDDEGDIRMLAELSGGSIQDVGCYPIRLARLLFEDEPDLDRAIADAAWSAGGVDEELWGALAFAGDRRLVFSCGFRAAYQTSTVILGATGEIRMTNPFHPEPGDVIEIVRDEVPETRPAAGAHERSFTPALRHINRVVRGLEEPRHLAVDEAMGNATAIAALLDAARG